MDEIDPKVKAALEKMWTSVKYASPDPHQKVWVNGEEMTMAEFVRRYEKGGIYSTQWDLHWMPPEVE